MPIAWNYSHPSAHVASVKLVVETASLIMDFQKLPNKLTNQSPTSSFHGKSSSHRWWCSMKKMFTLYINVFFCFCMFFFPISSNRDLPPTEKGGPQGAATSASSASQKHEVHPSQRTVNEPWNGGGTVGKMGRYMQIQQVTRRMITTWTLTYFKDLEVCVMLVQAKHKDKK